MTQPENRPDLSLQTREYLLVPLAVATGALVMFAMPPIGMPMVAAILGRIVYAGSPRLAGVTALLTGLGTAAYGVFVVSGQPTIQSGAAVAGTGIAPSIMVFVTTLGLWWAARAVARRPAWQVFAGTSAVGFGGYLVAWMTAAAAQGATLTQVVSAQVDVALEQIGPMLGNGAADPGVQEMQELVRTMVIQSWPGTSLVLIMLGAGLATMFLSRLARAHGLPTQGPRALVNFDVSWHVVWPLAAGFGVVAWMIWQDAQGTVVAGLGLNVLLVSGAVVLVQGFAVSEWLLKRLRLGVIPRVLVYGVLLWLFVLPPILFVIGIADLWLNIRKLPRHGSPGHPEEGILGPGDVPLVDEDASDPWRIGGEDAEDGEPGSADDAADGGTDEDEPADDEDERAGDEPADQDGRGRSGPEVE